MQSDAREQGVQTLLPLRTKVEGGLIGAAVGDALGWPQEDRASRLTSKEKTSDLNEKFFSWKRRVGGRFYPHQEEVNAGEYSDDTQLLIATARSLLAGEDWYRVLTEVELPFWTAYERGGGGATKRAAASWLSGKQPWNSVADQKRYFDAGGNGVVMRILPHCIRGAGSTSFAHTAYSIVTNGISTHGHPRALVGALAYGFVAWHRLRSSETLAYGALLDLLLDSTREWSELPESVTEIAAWLDAANVSTGNHYKDLWFKTVEEQLLLFRSAKTGLSKGALAVDQEVLKELGCFDKRVNGSGTVTAAGAVFLASRFAADPLNGVGEAANSRGADTDTLASLVGALVGIVNGIEWLGSLANEVQDSQYLERLAADLSQDRPSWDGNVNRITDSSLAKFLAQVPGLAEGQPIALPDGQKAVVRRVIRHRLGSGKSERVAAQCVTDAGQTLYFAKVVKSSSKTYAATQKRLDVFDPVRVERIVVRLGVRDLDEAKRFYVGALGLKITREAAGMITLGDALALSSRERVKEHQALQSAVPNGRAARVFIETKDLEAAHRNLRSAMISRLSDITRSDNRRHFTCRDPDGNVVEVFEPRPDGTASG